MNTAIHLRRVLAALALTTGLALSSAPLSHAQGATSCCAPPAACCKTNGDCCKSEKDCCKPDGTAECCKAKKDCCAKADCCRKAA